MIERVQRKIMMGAGVGSIRGGVGGMIGSTRKLRLPALSTRGVGRERNGAGWRIICEARRYKSERKIVVPVIAESIVECAVGSWYKKKGDYVKKGESIVMLESDKITTEIEAPESGRIIEVYANEGDSIEIGGDLLAIDTDDVEAESSESAKGSSEVERGPTPSESAKGSSKVERGSTPSENVKGSSEVERGPTPSENMKGPSKVEKGPSKVESVNSAKTTQEAKKQGGISRVQTTVPMSRIRLKIAERLKSAQNEAASLTTFNEVDMSNLIELRKRYGPAFMEKHKVKLGFMGFFMKACAIALMENPEVNSSIRGKDFIYSNYVDISVAVATEKGLVTPVIRNCNSISIAEMEKELSHISQKARQNKIAIEDMAGGTFTISNGGVFGSLFGTPIINPPQTAILGMHSTKKRPVEVDGKVEIRPMMYLALTYDHRVIDGKEAVTFLVDVKNVIEDPVRLILDV